MADEEPPKKPEPKETPTVNPAVAPPQAAASSPTALEVTPAEGSTEKKAENAAQPTFYSQATDLYKSMAKKKPEAYEGKKPEFKNGKMIVDFPSKEEELEYFQNLAASGEDFVATDNTTGMKKYSSENGILYKHSWGSKSVVPGQDAKLTAETHAIREERNKVSQELNATQSKIAEAVTKGETADPALRTKEQQLMKKESELFERLEQSDLKRESLVCRLKGSAPKETASRLEQLKGFYKEDAALRSEFKALQADKETYQRDNEKLIKEEAKFAADKKDINTPPEKIEAERLRLEKSRAEVDKRGAELDKRDESLTQRQQALSDKQMEFYGAKRVDAPKAEAKTADQKDAKPNMQPQPNTQSGPADAKVDGKASAFERLKASAVAGYERFRSATERKSEKTQTTEERVTPQRPSIN